MKKFLLILSFILLLNACASEDLPNPNIEVGYGTEVSTPAPEGWALLDQGDFTLYAPAGWKLTPQQGTDSYVGLVSGDGMTLTYDYGMGVGLFANNSEFKKSDYTIEKLKINGFDATIYRPKTSGSMEIDFEDPRGEGNLNLFGENLTADQEEIAVQIFKTIFLKQ